MKFSFGVLTVVIFLALNPALGSLGTEPTEVSDASSSSPTPATSTTTEMAEPDVIERWRELEQFAKKVSGLVVKAIMPEAVRAFQEVELSRECSRSLMKMLSGIKQMKLWAFRMLDASGKIPEGMVGGTFTTLGDYDSCIELDVPENKFRGQYCNLDLMLPLPPRERFQPGFKVIKELENFTNPDTIIGDLIAKARYFYRQKLRTALCVPSSCSREELEKIANRMIHQIGLDWNSTVSHCETKVEKVVFDTSQIVIIIVLSCLLTLAVTATVVDVVLAIRSKGKPYQSGLSMSMKCLMCFSFYTNVQKLLKPDKGPDSIKVFHGMKVITILWVILNHTFAYLNYTAMKVPLEHVSRYTEFEFQFAVNGYINVETFFFISAVLLAYGHMKTKGNSVNIPIFVFRRIWRLLPPFMFVIACVFLIPHLGSGPLWHEMVVKEITDKCRKEWWTNLLFINNFFSKENMCLHWMWYIPADTHLYFISLLVIIPLKKNPKLAFTINLLLFALFTTITAVIHVANNLHATGYFILIFQKDIDDAFIDTHYFRSWVHCATYTVGLTVGYLIATKPKFHIPLRLNILGWFVSLFMGAAMVYGTFWWNLGNFPGLFMATLYACFNKLIYSLALGYVTFACVTGNGGIVTRILSWGAFVPLGRLTYMVYLIHPVMQHMYIGSFKTLYYPNHRTMSFMYLAYVMISYMLAFALSMLFESPFLALERTLMSGRQRPPKAVTSNDDKEREVELGDQKHNGLRHLNGENGVYTINVKQIDNER